MTDTEHPTWTVTLDPSDRHWFRKCLNLIHKARDWYGYQCEFDGESWTITDVNNRESSRRVIPDLQRFGATVAVADPTENDE